jgi:ATP-dependent DNA helicase RecQ
MVLRRRQIDEKAVEDERRRIEHKRLNAMIDLCESALCRRSALLAYFGEETPRLPAWECAVPLRSLQHERLN